MGILEKLLKERTDIEKALATQKQRLLMLKGRASGFTYCQDVISKLEASLKAKQAEIDKICLPIMKTNIRLVISV